MTEPWCVCGHKPTEHAQINRFSEGATKERCMGLVGSDPDCSCLGYREARSSKDMQSDDL